MEFIQTILQVVIALGIFNVWLVRGSNPTNYRGGSASNIKEEFAIYGLPTWAFYIIGTTKIACAVALTLGIWLHALITPAASILGILMLGAILMHIKVKDPLIKSLPAATLLAMCLCLVLLT